jgi:hypothetical protein
LNPGKLEEILKRKEERSSVKRKLLMDQSLTDLKQKRMFDDEERTNHKDIAPARFRLTDFKRKSLSKLFHQRMDEKNASDIASSIGNADVTT